ncbi:hypothetical protein GOP47_0018350 [Adiantum capillus-veneris]|uniref:Uncharacterized protein n=1 Tax=Adiantum capillus-veneris TaxID=13818 RepID=A0A9D4ZBH9_ADICA|nr:hypothetical protein GOP47_0017992 [Adiantum capillus-veneris]KAI5067822.1 hypothetical protein GOP47_0018350 [Adiantum capillus-veneris]
MSPSNSLQERSNTYVVLRSASLFKRSYVVRRSHKNSSLELEREFLVLRLQTAQFSTTTTALDLSIKCEPLTMEAIFGQEEQGAPNPPWPVSFLLQRHPVSLLQWAHVAIVAIAHHRIIAVVT